MRAKYRGNAMEIDTTKWSVNAVGGILLRISEAMVLGSNGEYYIGHLCKAVDTPESVEPYDRISHYMSEEEATLMLKESDNTNLTTYSWV